MYVHYKLVGKEDHSKFIAWWDGARGFLGGSLGFPEEMVGGPVALTDYQGGAVQK